MKSKIHENQDKYLTMRKNNIVLIIALLLSITCFAQQGINYKALIKDDLGNVLANQEITLRFTIIEPLSSPTIRYQGTHNNLMTDANGIVTANIGNGSQSLSYGFFDDIEWEIHEHNLRVEIDITGGTNFVDFGTNEFNAVPYAKHAKTARTALNVSGLEQITQIGKTGWRLIDRIQSRYEPIGFNAVDLSYSYGNGAELFGATGDYSIATGRNTEAIGSSSSALGYWTIAYGDNSTAMGYRSAALGVRSTAMGYRTTAPSYAEVAVGSCNTNYTPINTLDWDENDRIFVVGNGNSPSNRSDAFTVLKNGNTGIGRATPSSLLEIAHENGSALSQSLSILNTDTNNAWQFHTTNYLNLYQNGIFKGSWNAASGAYVQASDRRVKKDIRPIGNNTLNKVMQLNPVSYLMKDQTDTKRNLGLISQEVQELFPSITHYVKESDLLALSYTELIPILIKAMQEQQNIIDAQNAKDVIQDKSIEALVARLSLLESKSNN